MMHRKAINTDRPPSIITTINLGFQAINRRVWVIAVPILLDLFLWLGPRVSPQPLLQGILRQVPQQARQQLQAVFDQWRDTGIDLRVNGSVLNFVRLLSGTDWIPQSPWEPTIWHVGSMAALLGALLLINVVGLLVSAINLLLIGDAVRHSAAARPPSPGESQAASGTSFAWRFLRLFARLGGVVALWSGLALLVVAPFAILASLLTFVSAALGLAMLLLGLVVVVWMAFTASFAFDAVVVSGVQPARALLGSVMLVRRWFWSAIGLIVVSGLIFTGMRVVWQMVASLGLPGVLIAFAGSGYIGAGLVAAHLMFYRDRIQSVTVPNQLMR